MMHIEKDIIGLLCSTQFASLLLMLLLIVTLSQDTRDDNQQPEKACHSVTLCARLGLAIVPWHRCPPL